MVVFVRNRFYDWGLLQSKTFKTPIICIGNLSVGGTGKTPMVELLVSLLKNDYKVAVLSRGYGRKSKGFVLADAAISVTDLGDEPFQIYNKHQDIIVAVDADRQNGIAMLEETIKPDIIILDDAFQHRKVKPQFSILLTAFSNLYVNDWYLPTGNLRDSKREAQRADIIIVTKLNRNAQKSQFSTIKDSLKPKEHQEVLYSFLAYDEELKGNGSLKNIAELKGKKVTLVTGIANPKPLVDFLTEMEVSFEHLSFRDHHFFTEKELLKLSARPNILTTEKDYMRLGDKVENCNYITIKHQFHQAGLIHLKNALKAFMK